MPTDQAFEPVIQDYSALPSNDKRAVRRLLTKAERKELQRRLRSPQSPRQKANRTIEGRNDLSPAFKKALIRTLAQKPGASPNAPTAKVRVVLNRLIGTPSE